MAPGPGAYEPLKMLARDGKYFCSKYKDSKSNALKSTAIRFVPERFRVPGPGHYDTPTPINPEGRNFVSRFQSCFSRSFGHEKRKFGIDKTTGKL